MKKDKMKKQPGGKTMKRNERGFTLIELVTVIAILGVLAAMTVPKFFSLQTKAKVEVENQIIGSIRAGLETYAANKIVQDGTKTYPATTTALLSEVLNPSPAEWKFTTGASEGTIEHTRTDSLITWTYSTTGSDYTIGTRVAN